MNEFKEAFDWRKALREHRKQRGISQPEVARRAGLSVSTVKACETGDRRPSPGALQAIIAAIGIPVEDANPIRAGAGYAIDWKAILNERYEPRDLDALAEEVEHYAWPVFVTNQATDLMCANRAFRRVVGIDPRVRLPDKLAWNFLAHASDPAFADRLDNWDESTSFMLGIAKADPRYAINLERPTPYLTEPLRKFLEGDPGYIRRVLGLWEQATAVPHTTRMRYAVRYRIEGAALLSFACTMHVADIWQELSWHDWVPADAATMAALESLC
jgi:transcriptional regulator with XRE-family HTH domain